MTRIEIEKHYRVTCYGKFTNKLEAVEIRNEQGYMIVQLDASDFGWTGCFYPDTPREFFADFANAREAMKIGKLFAEEA